MEKKLEITLLGFDLCLVRYFDLSIFKHFTFKQKSIYALTSRDCAETLKQTTFPTSLICCFSEFFLFLAYQKQNLKFAF